MSTTERNPSSVNPRSLGPTRPVKDPPSPDKSVADYPILTEVVENPAAPDPAPRNIGLEELERELRIELVGQLTADLERRVEARVHGRLSTSIDEIAGQVRSELFAEVRRAVREVVAEVMAEERKRDLADPPAAAVVRDS